MRLSRQQALAWPVMVAAVLVIANPGPAVAQATGGVAGTVTRTDDN